MIELLILNKNKIYYPLVTSDIILESHMSGSCAELNFSLYKDDIISFAEGDIVTLIVDGIKMFKGFIFIKKQTTEQIISVTCYDQLRYLLNHDTFVYANKTASDLIKNICGQYELNVGNIVNTNLIIPYRVDADRKLLDIINTALTTTTNMTNKKYVFYDDFNSITLKNINDMKTNYLLDNQSYKNSYYESNINDSTYNQIKVIDDLNYKTRIVVVEKNEDLIKKYGVLQKLYYLKEELNPKEFAKKRLEELKEKSITFNIYGALGKLDLRAGNSIIVDLQKGEYEYKERFLITYIKHKIKEDFHEMDMTIKKDICLSK